MAGPQLTAGLAALLLALLALGDGRLCVLVTVPPGSGGPSAIRAARQTWSSNYTFFVGLGAKAAQHWRLPGIADEVPAGIQHLCTWAYRMPEECEWVLKVEAGTYLNVAGLEERLKCIENANELRYLGLPKMVSASPMEPIRVADGEAGIVLRRSLAQAVPWLLEQCARSDGFHLGFTAAEDVMLGSCLWMHGIEMHAWMDPVDEAFFDHDKHALPHPSMLGMPRISPFRRIMDRYSSNGLSNLQCVLLISGLSPAQVLQIHAMQGKSRRWFRNIACVPGGLLYPELTSANTLINGVDRSEPFFSTKLRKALQDCFLAQAFAALSRESTQQAAAPITGPPLASPAALAAEWRHPAPPMSSPATDRLRRGGHLLCIFVLATAVSAKHMADAAAVLRSWAAEGPGSRAEGVEVFVVDRLLPGPPEAMLRLSGDVDLGFLFNTVRAYYLWRYLAENHRQDCAWFMKADADTLVNTWALKERLLRYFDPEGLHYLGSRKDTLLGSGRRLSFPVNAAVLSRGLLGAMAHWLEICIDDLVKRKLGRGAEDIDLAYCLDKHGEVTVEPLGSKHELMSRGMARASSGSSGLLGSSGACTLWVHPVHAPEMLSLYTELLRLRGEAVTAKALEPGTEGERLCDWPEEAEVDAKTWGIYMKQTHADGKTDCWMGEFTWNACCNPKVWGAKGNDLCWDEEHTHERCCWNRGQQMEAPALPPSNTPPSTALPSTTAPPASASVTLAVDREPDKGRAQSRRELPRPMQIKPLVLPDSSQRGNPKCWGKTGFTYEVCCLGPPEKSSECWAWPYTPGFCCSAPLPPRQPVQVGGRGSLMGASASSHSHLPSRTARCRGGEEEEAGSELLACSRSLDEIGALFELSVSGAGDKASGWHDYLSSYERLLLHLPLSANVLEVGVRSGLSLAMWAEYFPLGEVVGIDKSLRTFEQFRPVLEQHGAFSRNNVRAVQANASDPSVLAALQEVGASEAFADLIVDDGNHWAKDQLARFEMLFPSVLRPGGVYIIEDVHIQAPFSHDGIAVRAYFANLSASAYLTEEEILVGAHQIEAVRRASGDWRHQVEAVTFMRDLVAVTKAA